MTTSAKSFVWLSLVAALLLVLGAAPAFAGPITFYGSGSINISAQAGGGQNITFAGLELFGSDFPTSPQVTLSAGSAAAFLFNSASGGHGYFAPLSGANFSMGSTATGTATGIATGSISSIEILGAMTGSSMTSFSLQLNFGNLAFKSCSTVGCENNAVLQQFSTASVGDGLISFSLQNSVASSVAQLLGSSGTPGSTLQAQFESDSSLTPEPASLALFGSGLLFCGLWICRQRTAG